ncbi:MAG: 3-oxoacyl-ACP reductase [Actinomycetales bacterium]
MSGRSVPGAAPARRHSGGSGSRDSYARLVESGPAGFVASRLGLPRPIELRRHAADGPLIPGRVLVLGDTGRSAGILADLSAAGVLTSTSAEGWISGVIIDAVSASRISALDDVRSALHNTLTRLQASGRVVILGPVPDAVDPVNTESAAVAQALEGLVRSTAKELRKGATANLVQLGTGADPWPAVRFLLSGGSAYVDGQVLVVGAAASVQVAPEQPLDGRVAVVTGAARGIGAAIVETLGRDGARVLCVDVPAAGQSLAAVANSVAGTALHLDVTRADAGHRIAEAAARLGGLDIVVHNAGITRDRLVVNMEPSKWAAVLEVNLAAQVRIDDILLAEGSPLASQARFVAVSSVSGIAGNRGQTNYAASKAGVIGAVRARARQFIDPDGCPHAGRTYNAVAPGFIDTEMTARMPFGPRELGRRLNSLSQAGLPVDVAEAVAFFARPDSGGVNGQVLRVCGQSILGR